MFASLTSILGKIGIDGVESQTSETAIRTGVVLIMAWLIVFIRASSTREKDIPNDEPGPRSAFPDPCYRRLVAATNAQSGAPGIGLASVVVPIDKLSILVSIGFSALVFKERLSKKAAVGLVLNSSAERL